MSVARLRELALALGALAASGCGGAPRSGPAAAQAAPIATPGPRKSADPTVPFAMVTPSRLVPDFKMDRGVWASENGHRRVLVDELRLIEREDGTVERAAERFPIGGPVTATPLPSRLGGGYLFVSSGGSGTQMWRSPSWLAKLEPLVQFSEAVREVVPGFDRLYVRLQSRNRVFAIDAGTGKQMPIAPLPPAAAYGAMVFADGWRAVIDTDLRGPLATFDAGMTWRPVGVKERVLSMPVMSGDPALVVAGGIYRLAASGTLTFDADDDEPVDDVEEGLPGRPVGPFGKRPLRAAVEDGWPDEAGSAVVARAGALARISVRDGAVLAVTETAYPERLATCHAVPLGPQKGRPSSSGERRAASGFGFVCGERDGPTTIYAFEPPLSMRAVMRFSRPRFVAASGNGAVVVRGPCVDGAAATSDSRPYCVRDVSGAAREIRVKGDLGSERVVALADGRVAVVVPPRPGATGQLTLLHGAAMTSMPLALPSSPRAVAREVRRGMWLEGLEEREPGVLAGWVEAGGPVVGIRIALDGKVTAGELRDDAGGVVFGGRFALSRGEGGRAAESVDGGMTWKPFELPRTQEEPLDSPTRSCGPVGCALHGWLRVGWGEPATAEDLAAAEAPRPFQEAPRVASNVAFQCVEAGQVTPPLPPEKPRPSPRVLAPTRPTPHLVFGGGLRAGGVIAPPVQTPWLPFRNTVPPALSKDEIGFDNGSGLGGSSDVGVRGYAWGRKGADWTRSGRFLIRFDDPFDPGGGVRSSSASASPWADEASAAEAIGGNYGQAWAAFLDPSGRAALVHSCRSNVCALHAVAHGQPVLPVRDASGRTAGFPRAVPHGAVRDGESWFFLSHAGVSTGDAVALYRIDLGVGRHVATFTRPSQSSGYANADPPRLVRRALGGGIGILVSAPPHPGSRAGTWHVHPVDAETGALGDPIPLARKDLAGVTLERCGASQDGWQLDTALDAPPSLDLGVTSGSLDSAELRLRMDPGSVCVDAIAARGSGSFARAAPDATAARASATPKRAESATPSIPLSATDGSGRRFVFRCAQKTAGR